MTDQSLTLHIDGMTCAGCAGRAERALAAVDGVASATVNLATQTAHVTTSERQANQKIIDALSAAGYPARTTSARLQVSQLSCASCVGRAEQALAALPGVTSAVVNLASETALVHYFEGALQPSDLARALGAAGYPATLSEPATAASATERRDAEIHTIRARLLWAAAFALPVFILEMGAHLVPAFHHLIAATIGMQTSWVLQFVLASLVLFGPGRTFFQIGIRTLLKGAPDMNALVAVGTGAAWGFSVIATFAPRLLPEGVRAVYFEAAAVIVVLILLGRWLEARAKGRTGAAIQALLGLQVRRADVERDGTLVDVPVEALEVGDLVRVKPGARLPVDGVVMHGYSYVDESMISGEPVPVAKSRGSEVTGGTVNGNGSLTLRVNRVGAETTLAQIIRMVEDAQGAKLPIQGLVDRVTLWFVPGVMALAALTVGIWLLFGPDPALTYALVAGVSVLIIACPCAMGLATPTSIMVGTGRAADMGVLFRKGDALQTLSDAQVIALDKTGTLTEGKPALTDITLAPGLDEATVLRAVAAVEAHSEHPIARALLQAAEARGLEVPVAEEFEAVTGYGAQAQVDGHLVRVGAGRFLQRAGISVSHWVEAEAALARQGKTALYAAIDGTAVALLAVSDPIKPSTRAAIEALQKDGLHIALITGDNAATAQAIAQEVGITDVIADVLPEGKVAAIDALKTNGRRVVFVGDGINDAPALAHADVGIAIGTGTDVAIESADIVLMSGDLRGVVNALYVSRRTMANIRQNLIWAFGYNVALLPIAAGVLYPAFGLLLSPVFAAGAMALSSVSVLSNALRLRRLQPKLTESVLVAPDVSGVAAPKKAAVS